MEDVDDSPEVLKRLWRLLVLHGEHEVKEVLVIHLSFVGLVLFKDSVDEDVGEARRVSRKLLFLQHTVAVLIEAQIVVVNAKGRLHTEPVAKCLFKTHLLRLELVQLSQNWAGKHVFDHDFASSLRVQVEEELPDSGDNIERIEGLLELLKLRECWHQLEDVVFEILLSQVAVATGIIQADLDPRLEEVHLPDDVMEKWCDLDSAVFIALKFQEGACSEKLLAFLRQLG